MRLPSLPPVAQPHRGVGSNTGVQPLPLDLDLDRDLDLDSIATSTG